MLSKSCFQNDMFILCYCKNIAKRLIKKLDDMKTKSKVYIISDLMYWHCEYTVYLVTIRHPEHHIFKKILQLYNLNINIRYKTICKLFKFDFFIDFKALWYYIKIWYKTIDWFMLLSPRSVFRCLTKDLMTLTLIKHHQHPDLCYIIRALCRLSQWKKEN